MSSTVITAVAIVFSLISAKALLVYRAQRAVFLSVKGPVERPPASFELAGLRNVTFGSPGALCRGWMLNSRNGAAVILLHGAGANRTQMLPEASIFARAGYGVLLFDWPGSGESDGRSAWGEPERQALRAATDWLVTETSLAPQVAAVGFSMGGAILAQSAAQDPRLRAVILLGTYASSIEQNRQAFGRWAPVLAWPAGQGWWWSGMSASDPQPISVVPSIGPRPVMVITGTNDHTVPSWMSRRLYEAAAHPKEFWLVTGAGHGRYDEAASDYGARLLQFVASALGPTKPAASGQ